MPILFDQGTPLSLRDSLHEHVVKTAHQQGWSTLLNGELLRAADQAGFDVLVTTDKNLVCQQNLSGRKIAIVVLGRNRWSLIRSTLPGSLARSTLQSQGATPWLKSPTDSG